MMKKIILLVIFCSTLFGRSSFIAELIFVPSNSLQIFRIQGTTFSCSQYGILTLDTMIQYKNINKTCKKQMALFFAKDPTKRFFASRHLHVTSFYNLRYMKGRCVIFASGQKSFAELLLENGLALVKRGFHDAEFHALFLRAQRHAQENKLGIWSNNTLKICALGLYKKL